MGLRSGHQYQRFALPVPIALKSEVVVEVSLADIIANPGVYLFGLLLAVLGLSYISNYCLCRVFGSRTYRYLVAPGIAVHESSHALGCVITGARIRDIRIFKPTGGHIVYEPPHLRFGDGVIAVAPIFGAALAVYALARLLVPGFVGYGVLEFSTWQFLVFAYLAGSIVATMAPSRSDLEAGAAGFAVLCLLVGLAAASQTMATYFGWLLGDTYEHGVMVVKFALAVLATLAVASAAAYGIVRASSRL